ncbi:enoyl-CoA hydratase/isomerase family protein [Hyphomonas sp. CACIAM 19H1]|nr:enoyl-CoA hydratase/isomerase family protein [Hyphomonas sp. CACIAM 19H1]
MTRIHEGESNAMPLSDHTVSFQRSGAVALIEFSRPPANFFSAALLAEIVAAFERADADPDVRAIVLASEGKNFCAGADLAGEDNDPFELYDQAERLFAIRKPSVAAVQGAAIGGGLGLALAADFRVVTTGTRLSANFVKLGMHPGFAMTATLPRLVGDQCAALLFLTARRVSGEEAVNMGLADIMAPSEDLLNAALALAGEIAENAPLAVEATRATLRREFSQHVRRHTSEEARRQLQLKRTEDFAEGVAAVNARRPGNWKRR